MLFWITILLIILFFVLGCIIKSNNVLAIVFSFACVLSITSFIAVLLISCITPSIEDSLKYNPVFFTEEDDIKSCQYVIDSIELQPIDEKYFFLNEITTKYLVKSEENFLWSSKTIYQYMAKDNDEFSKLVDNENSEVHIWRYYRTQYDIEPQILTISTPNIRAIMDDKYFWIKMDFWNYIDKRVKEGTYYKTYFMVCVPYDGVTEQPIYEE